VKKTLLPFILLGLVISTGCAKSVRYTQEEIMDFPPSVQENIKKNEITTGMTRLQVRYSWGAPDEVRVVQPAEDGKERVEWVYKKMEVFRTRLIFTDDKLTEIISSEPGVVK
jgi:predicted transcriptional regulator